MADGIGFAIAIAVGAFAVYGFLSERRAIARIESGRATLRDLVEYTGIESRAAILRLRDEGLDMRPIGVSGRDVLYMIDPVRVAELRTWFQCRIDTGPLRWATTGLTLALCAVAAVAFLGGWSWGWPLVGGAFWIQLSLLLARVLYVDRKVDFSTWMQDLDESILAKLAPAGFDAKPIVWQPFGPAPSEHQKPQFRFLISGRHISGQGFYKTMYAIARTRQEAETYLRTFLNFRPEYVTWEVVEVARAAEPSREADCVCDPGPITLFRPGSTSQV
jgi:hypothetical protein